MNFNVKPPSLEHRALIEIAIMLCGQGIRRDFMSKLHPLSSQKIFEIVSQNVTVIKLPPLLKEKLFAIIDAVLSQKQSWTLFHMRKYKFVTELPIMLVWTAQGTIDYKRTAELLVKDERIELEKRYNLTCLYCLEEDILDLQEKFRNAGNISDGFLVSYWSNYEKGYEHVFDSTHAEFFYYECLFNMSAVLFKNETPLKYFYTKLMPENAENIKMQTAKMVANLICYNNVNFPGNQCNDILYFLLTTMNAEQQTELSQNHTYEVLRSLLVWPRQSLFLEVAKDKFNFLSKDEYYLLLCDIVDGMTYKCSYLREIFLKFWQQSPKTYKQFVISEYGSGRLLLMLYKREDEISVKMILDQASISAKKNIIFSDAGQDICKYLVYSEKWDSVEYLIQECISSPQEMAEFKGKFTQNVTELRSGNILAKDHQWNKFLRFVENFIIIPKKRKFKKDDNTSTKKVCRKNIQK